MDPSDRIVASFLSKRGYKQAEMLLRQEAKITGSTVKLDENSIANYVLFYNEDEANNPAAYEQSLYSLRKWIDDSIDIYKKELQRILFPIFVHAYLDLVAKGLQSNGLSSNTANDFFDKFHNDHHEYHATDISKLRSVIDQMHMSQNDLVQNFRNNKYGVKMSKYSFELLLCFLQDNKFMLLLRLMNQYINIESLCF
jgi:transcription initiation factor TFIID subunit 5